MKLAKFSNLAIFSHAALAASAPTAGRFDCEGIHLCPLKEREIKAGGQDWQKGTANAKGNQIARELGCHLPVGSSC